MYRKTKMEIHLPLVGGLGNQLFQFCSAMAYAKKLDAKLLIDTRVHFLIDFRYRQKLQLGFLSTLFEKMPLPGSICSQILFRLMIRFRNKNMQRFKFRSFTILVEPGSNYRQLPSVDRSQHINMIGYWQSPKYFEEYFDLLKPHFEILYQRNNLSFSRTDQSRPKRSSVSVGIRLYEETRNPGYYSESGQTKNSQDYRRALSRMKQDLDNPKFYLFTTQLMNRDVQDLKEEFEMEYVDDRDPIRVMLLFSQSDHFIFNNSTFYWWGAYLAEKLRPSSDRKVFASDNFVNRDIYLSHWVLF